MYSRAEVIHSSMSVSEIIENAHNEDMVVHIKEKTEIVTGWLFVNGRNSNATFKSKYRFTDIWFKQNGLAINCSTRLFVSLVSFVMSEAQTHNKKYSKKQGWRTD